MTRPTAIAALAAYIATIAAANWATATYGLVPIGFGLLVTAGTFAAGAALVFRDAVQVGLGRWWVIAAVLAGAALSWLWQKSKSRDGYGWTSLNDRTYQAHRLVYRLIKGGIPDGLVIDHLCRVRHCVFPGHMEPVTPAENLLRSELTPAGRKECIKGHGPLSKYGNQRRCIPCLREYERERRRAS